MLVRGLPGAVGGVIRGSKSARDACKTGQVEVGRDPFIAQDHDV